MKALKGQVPRPPGDCRRKALAPYLAYVRAKAARLGHLNGDAMPWLREAGLMVLALDALHRDELVARAALENGVGRRQREKLRIQLRQLERRAARLRGGLESAERRLEELAGREQPKDLASRLAEVQR